MGFGGISIWPTGDLLVIVILLFRHQAPGKAVASDLG